jgi:signal transduction histidine kinase
MATAERADEARTISARQLAEMAATSEALASGEDLLEILQRLAARARELTNADYAAISIVDEDGRLSRFVYAGIEEEVARRLGDPPVGRGLLSELNLLDGPIRLSDVRHHPSHSGWPPGHPEMGPLLGVPVRAGGRTLGSIFVTRVAGAEPFAESDELSSAVLAVQASVGVATALSRERTGRLFLLEERERIAHDLHDGTIQSLYALGLEFDALRERAVVPDVREALQDGVDRINRLIAEIRQYITMLEAEAPASQPELSRDLSFVIRQLVPAGIDTVVNITAAALQEITAREAEDFLYIAREALSNATRHGRASKIAVDLRQTASETALTIQDNGVGFDQANAHVGLGTVTMRTRAERLGGTITVLGIPGMGTTVRVAIPRSYDD